MPNLLIWSTEEKKLFKTHWPIYEDSDLESISTSRPNSQRIEVAWCNRESTDISIRRLGFESWFHQSSHMTLTSWLPNGNKGLVKISDNVYNLFSPAISNKS